MACFFSLNSIVPNSLSPVVMTVPAVDGVAGLGSATLLDGGLLFTEGMSVLLVDERLSLSLTTLRIMTSAAAIKARMMKKIVRLEIRCVVFREATLSLCLGFMLSLDRFILF